MPSDLMTLRPLALELNDVLSGGKVDKVNMPEADEVRLQSRVGGENLVRRRRQTRLRRDCI